MQFLNAEHKKSFRFAADLCCNQDKRWLATAYIITASTRLYFDAEPFMGDCYINFARIQFSPCTPTEAALYNAAIDIWNMDEYFNLSDLTGEIEIPDAALIVITNALLYLRFGFDAEAPVAKVTELR